MDNFSNTNFSTCSLPSHLHFNIFFLLVLLAIFNYMYTTSAVEKMVAAMPTFCLVHIDVLQATGRNDLFKP